MVHNCSSSTVTVNTNALEGLDTLEVVTFQNIANLHLESGSLHPFLVYQSNFTLTFDSVLSLSFSRDAVRIEGQGGPETHENVVIQNSFIKDLEERSITGNLSKISLERVILSPAPASNAINVGTKGASIIINYLDALNQGLSSGWIKGHASRLFIANSNLTLQANAFAEVHIMRGTSSSSEPQFTLRNNRLGFPKWFPGMKMTPSVPSLPSGSLDIQLPSGGIAVDAANNQITCECADLVWLNEQPDSAFKSQIQSSTKCLDGRIAAAAVEECHHAPSSGASRNNLNMSLILNLTIVFSLVVTRVAKRYC